MTGMKATVSVDTLSDFDAVALTTWTFTTDV